MINEELDYDVPSRTLVWVWLVLAGTATVSGFWHYSIFSMAVLCAVTLVWVNLYSTILHYALDAEEFTKLPVVGGAFVRFQSHHFPKWINVIHRKPVLDLLGELNPVAVINLASALVLLRLGYREVFAAWGVLMLTGGYAMLCHRWAHQPARVRPRVASELQRVGLALDPKQHWAHHALAASPMGEFVPNFDLSFGWSNGLFNRVLKVLPSARLWLGFIVAATLTQVSALAILLHWLRR
jgi:hypothetical protein